MKKLLGICIAGAALMAGPALAADFPVKAPIYKAPPPVFSWTGCYIGAHVGGGWGSTSWASTAGLDEGTSDISGVLGGGQIGCDYQTGPLVIGAEGSFSWSSIKGSHRDPVPAFNDQILNTEVQWITTVTGRVGYALGRILFYAKGGGAWAYDKYWDVRDGVGTVATATETRSGWTVGGGVEYAFAPNWSMKVEYDYLNFGTSRATLICPPCMAGFFLKDIKQDIHTVKLGVNYRFNWWL